MVYNLEEKLKKKHTSSMNQTDIIDMSIKSTMTRV